MKSRLLLVEDDTNLATVLATRLRDEGYEVEVCLTWHPSNGPVGRDAPDKSGFEVCSALRSRGIRKPVLMLNARREVDERVAGLRLGADDCLTKPFEVAELIARLEALERRARANVASAPIATLSFADIVVDLVGPNSSPRSVSRSPVRTRVRAARVSHPASRGRMVA
jgi:DNA-binding response OmpR family regulator